MKHNQIRQVVFPILAALIWGTAFVAQDVCADTIGTFTFNIYRLTKAYRHGQEIRSATEMQDSLLRERHKEPVAPIVEPTQTRQR